MSGTTPREPEARPEPRPRPERREAPRRESDNEQLITAVAELLKYPFLVASIFLALAGAKAFLGMQIGAVIGSDGQLQFVTAPSADSLREVTVHLELQLKDALTRIGTLETQLRLSGTAPSLAWTEAHFDSLQEVPAEAIALSRSAASADGKPILAGREGYVWIGDYEAGRGWGKRRLSFTDGERVEAAPGELELEEYEVTGNLVLRDGPPDRGTQYFLSRATLGVIPSHAKVLALEKPLQYPRPYATQYWMKVRVLEE